MTAEPFPVNNEDWWTITVDLARVGWDTAVHFRGKPITNVCGLDVAVEPGGITEVDIWLHATDRTSTPLWEPPDWQDLNGWDGLWRCRLRIGGRSIAVIARFHPVDLT